MSPKSYHLAQDALPMSPRRGTTFDLDALVAEAAALEASLANWPSLVPPHWRPIPVSSFEQIHRSIGQSDMYGESCDMYPSIEVAGTWDWYRTLHVSTIRILLVCYTWLDHASKTKTQNFWTPALEGTLQKLTDDFCGSIPFHLGSRQGDSLERDPSDFQYPILPSTAGVGSDESLRITAVSPGEHKHTAALAGTWYLLDPLHEILQMTFPSTSIVEMPSSNIDHPDALQPLLHIREGQREWVFTQLKRIESINESDRVRRIMPS